MSKKKNKFKRSKQSHPQSQVSTPVTNSAGNLEGMAAEPLAQPAVTSAPAKSEPDDFYTTNQYAHVRRDIKIVLALLLGIIILLFAIYYLGLKTTYLTTFGNWIYRILNISTQ